MADLFMRPNELQPAHASAEGTLAAPDHDGSLVSPRRGDVLSSVVQTADAANILAVYAASEVIVAHELERVEADLAWREAAIGHLTKEREQLLEHKKAKQLQQSTLEKTTQSFKDMTQVMAPTHEDRPVVKHQHEAVLKELVANLSSTLIGTELLEALTLQLTKGCEKQHATNVQLVEQRRTPADMLSRGPTSIGTTRRGVSCPMCERGPGRCRWHSR